MKIWKTIKAAHSALKNLAWSVAGHTMDTTLNMGTNLISNVVDPVANQDAATKFYVDEGVWMLPPIIDFYDPTGGLPVAPTVGDRYISDATANGWTIDYVYEWDGVSWVETPPEEGFTIWSLLDLIFFVFFTGGWMPLPSTDHGELLGLLDDDHTQYLLAGGTRVLSADWEIGEKSIGLDPALSADELFSGIYYAGVVGYTATQGDLVYLAAVDGRWELADADAEATAGPVWLGLIMESGKNDGDSCKIFLKGMARSAAFGDLTTNGAALYVSTTAGDITQTAPVGTADIVRVAGYVSDASIDQIYFDPDQSWVELV